MSGTQTKVGSKAWGICLVAVFGGISLALVQNKISPVITVLIDTFDISMATAGLLSTIFTVMGMVMALPAAIILKKMGPKMAGVLALGCAIVGSVIGALSDNVTVLIISRVIEGSGVGIIAVLAPAVISMWFPPEKRGFPMGIWGSWMMISQTVLFLASTPIIESIGWQGMWYLGLASCVIAVVLFLIVVQSPPPELNNAPVQDTKISMLEGLKSAPSWLLALAAGCFTFCSFTFVSWVSPYWTEVTGWPIETIRNWVSLLYFVEIIYAVIVGFILNKVRKRKELGAIGFIIYGLVGMFSFLVTQSPLVVALVFVFPIFDALIPCICWVVGPETAKNPAYIGISLGILNIGLNLGTLLSAPISGWLVELNGWSAAGWCFLAAAILGCVFMALVIVASRKKATEN
jgi:predicted MFS family arabinose efflux permease